MLDKTIEININEGNNNKILIRFFSIGSFLINLKPHKKKYKQIKRLVAPNTWSKIPDKFDP